MHVGIGLMGFFVGLLVGLTGVGAAALMTPVFLMMGIHPSVAVGTDLLYNAVTKLFGFVRHWRQRTVQFGIVLYLAIGSLPSATFAVLLLHHLGGFKPQTEHIIRISLGVVLVLSATATMLRLWLERKQVESPAVMATTPQLKPIRTVLIGIVFGFAVGLTSVGSGSLFGVALLFLYRMSGPTIVGTDIAHAFLVSALAGLLHAHFGHVNYMLMGNLLIGSVPGVWLGSAWSTKVPTKPLRAIMSVLILISGMNLV